MHRDRMPSLKVTLLRAGRFALLHDPPGVRHVLDNGTVTIPEDRDCVKPIQIAGLPMACDPGPGDIFDLAALGPGDRVEGVAVRRAGARLDLDKRDQVRPADDKVDLLVADPIVPGEDILPQCREVICCDLLGPRPEFV